MTDAKTLLRGIKAVTFEGGGVLGFGYGPVIEAGEQAGWEPELFAGTSAGAITALVLALGADARYVHRLIKATPWERFESPSWPKEFLFTKLRRLFTRGGLNSLDYPRQWLSDVIEDFGYNPETLTFGQLYAKTGRSLCVPVTAEDQERPELLGRWGSDSRSHLIRDAVLASMAIPFYFEVARLRTRPYCDGGLCWNDPIDVVRLPWPRRPDGYAPHEVLGARVDKPAEIHPDPEAKYRKGIVRRVFRVFRILRKQANEAHVDDELWPRLVRINAGALQATDFDLTSDEIMSLREAGDVALAEWVQRQRSAE